MTAGVGGNSTLHPWKTWVTTDPNLTGAAAVPPYVDTFTLQVGAGPFVPMLTHCPNCGAALCKP